MAVLQKKASSNLTISVIIPTYQRPKLAMRLAEQIRSIHTQAQIIIVDQEYTLTMSSIALKKLEIELYHLPQANGSIAKNKGLEASRGDIIFFFDDDVEVTPHIFENHLKHYADPKIMGVAGRVLNDGESIPTNSDVETGKTNWLGTKFIWQYWSTRRQVVDFPYGCNMSFRRLALEKIKGFDARFSKIFDEIDLGVRISTKMGVLLFEPDALVYHHRAPMGGTRTKAINKMNMIYAHYGTYIAKHVPFPFSLITLALRSRSALKESPYALGSLYQSYIRYFLNPLTAILLTIFVITALFRFWKIPERFIFDIDAQYQALFAKTIINHFHIIWIGVSASNLGYYLGPGLVYMTAFLLWLSKGDPIILGYFASFLGLLTIFSIFYIADNLYGRKVGILSAIIYGASFFISSYDRKYWPILIPLIAVWIFFSLAKAEKRPQWLFVAVTLISIAYHVHLSLFMFWPFILWRFYRLFKKIDLKTWIGSILVYFAVTFPLLVFDLLHNFDNLLTPMRFFQIKQGTSGFQSHIVYLVTLINKVWFSGVQNVAFIQIFLTLFSVLLLGYVVKKRKKFSLLTGIMVTFTLLFSFYPGPIQEYYIVLLFPFLAITAGLLLSNLSQMYTVSLLSLFLFANIFTLITFQTSRGLNIKKDLVEKTSRHIQEPYYLDFEGELDMEGWHYLFTAYGKQSAQSKTDNMFGWLYPNEISNTKPKLRVYILNDYRRDEALKNIILTTKSGPYTAYIVRF